MFKQLHVNIWRLKFTTKRNIYKQLQHFVGAIVLHYFIYKSVSIEGTFKVSTLTAKRNKGKHLFLLLSKCAYWALKSPVIMT